MHPSPIAETSNGPIERVGSEPVASRDTRASIILGCELLIEPMQRSIARQNRRHARVRFAPRADGRDELPVLQLDAVGRYVDLADVDSFFLAVEQIVVPGDVGAGVADVSEEAPQRSVIVEAQAQRADRAGA